MDSAFNFLVDNDRTFKIIDIDDDHLAPDCLITDCASLEGWLYTNCTTSNFVPDITTAFDRRVQTQI